MSTYYRLKCDECGDVGGFFTRQAWGVGNADVIYTMIFLMHHAVDCGAKFSVISEHDDEYDKALPFKEFLKKVGDDFPHDNMWHILTRGTPVRQWWDQWCKDEIAQQARDAGEEGEK